MTINVVLSAILLIFTISFAILIFYAWKKRESPIVISYGLGVVVASLYTIGYAFQLISQSVEQSMFWIHIQYLGIPFSSLLWIILIFQFTGKQHLLTKRNVFLMAIPPISTLVFNLTNEWHYLFYRSIEADYSRGFFLLHLNRGPLFYLHIFFVITYYLVGLYFLIGMYRKTTQEMKKQALLIMIGSFVFFGFPLIHSIDIFKTPFDISPFGLILAGLFYLWGIYRFNILNLSPIVMNKVFDSIHDAVIIFDLDNYLKSYNNTAAKLLEFKTDKKLNGQPATKVLNHFPILLQMIEKQLVDSNTSRTSEKLGERHYNIDSSIIRGRNNKPVGKMLIFHDITESILYEESLLQQSKQLEELNLFKDKMFSIVAHDIRDPLAVLVNLIEIMEEELQQVALLSQDGSYAEIVEEMRKQINNTFLLVESLLEWFHTQRGGQLFNPVVRDLGKIVDATIILMLVKTKNKHIQIKSHIPDELYVYADKDMLELIVRNLLSNAIKFTKIGGDINLYAEVIENKVVVAVKDSGQGMTDEEAKHILQDEFPMSKRGTAGEQGVGLGLSICREFVRLNGGEIWFDSLIGEGTTFYFSLPISKNNNKPTILMKEEFV